MVIRYSRQTIDNSDIQSVSKTLKSDWLTTGPNIGIFENDICKKVSVKYGVAVNSATSALHIACKALGLSSGDNLWTSSNSFIASANCGLYCGAKVDLVDIDLDTQNISITKLKEKLINSKKKDLPKILIPVAFAGQSCEMKKIYELSKKFNFKIIEDASHALGAKYFNHSVGSCKYSDITVFSFHPVKMITTGEGGIALTNNLKFSNKMKDLRSHGVQQIKKKNFRNSKRPWMFYQNDLGFNYRMTDIQASLGISQLKKLKKFVSKRNRIAKFYNEELKNLPLQLPLIKKNNYSSFHLYVVQVLKNKKKINRDTLYKKLHNLGIYTNIHYIPIYIHPYYKKIGFKKKFFLNNNIYFSRALSLPIYPLIKKKELNKVVNSLKKIFS
jgi:UDP-4-amino-4,6-dideoxy-N-acetyl-beta-L-altrosamine transaminase